MKSDGKAYKCSSIRCIAGGVSYSDPDSEV